MATINKEDDAVERTRYTVPERLKSHRVFSNGNGDEVAENQYGFLRGRSTINSLLNTMEVANRADIGTWRTKNTL